jgi:uncharacterized protein DUF1883/TIR domain-containing protein
VQFLHRDLGHQRRGAVVEVTLRGSAANVRLLDPANFQAFRKGRQHRYYGGFYRRSPVRIPVPRDGRWHVTVDLGGHPGRLGATIAVLPGRLQPGRSVTPSLGSIAQNAGRFEPEGVTRPAERQYDVFVCHATEDKDAVVRPLAVALAGRDLGVWYDEFELRIGDSLRRKVDAGLAASRFGVVVLSHAFFAKNWPQYELDGLVTREMEGGQQIILPLWHEISKDEVMRQSPSLADKVALQTALYSIEEIAEQIAEVIKGGTAEAA